MFDPEEREWWALDNCVSSGGRTQASSTFKVKIVERKTGAKATAKKLQKISSSYDKALSNELLRMFFGP